MTFQWRNDNERERAGFLHQLVGQFLHHGMQVECTLLAFDMLYNFLETGIEDRGLLNREVTRDTLGTYVKRMETVMDLNDHERELLQYALDIRNWIVHYFFPEQFRSALESEDGYKLIQNFLEDNCTAMASLDFILQRSLRHACTSHGVNIGSFTRDVRELPELPAYHARIINQYRERHRTDT